jgi:BlaI family penicillinase repressor
MPVAASIPSITDAEWEVMKVIWDSPPGRPPTAGEVARRVGEGRDWHPRTVKTLLARLVRKGAVEMRQESARFVYRPRVSREACRREETRSFLDRVFDGAVTPAIVHFVQNAKLSKDEIDELKQLLERRGK